MRFLHVNHRYWPYHGGSERYIQSLAEHQAQIGNVSAVVTTNASDLEYFWDRNMSVVHAPVRESLNGVSVSRIPVKHFPVSSTVFPVSRRMMGEGSRVLRKSMPFRRLAAIQPWLPELSAELERLSPVDVIHGTNLGLEGPAITAGQIARKWNSLFVLTPFVHLGEDYSDSARRYVSMPHQLELLRGADLILTMTDMERDFIAGLEVERDKIHTVGAGVDFTEVTGGNPNAFRQKYHIGEHLVATIGALAPEKGTNNLVRAVRMLRKNGVDVTLALAGPVLSGFRTWFNSLDELEKEGIIFTGIVSPEEKRNLLAATDVLAMPSRTESFGIVYLEAWANRKPVIAASVGAVPELVHDNVNGILVKFGNDLDIARQIQRLIDDPEFAGRLGQRGFQTTKANFTWDAVLNRVTAAYESMLGYSIC